MKKLRRIRHKQAAVDLSIKAIHAVSASNAKIAVQPDHLNCGAKGIAPSPADLFADAKSFICEYKRGRQ